MRKLLLILSDKLLAFSSLTTPVWFRSMKFLPSESVTDGLAQGV